MNPNWEEYNCRDDCTRWEKKLVWEEGCTEFPRERCLRLKDVCTATERHCARRPICERLTAPSKLSPYRMSGDLASVIPQGDFTWQCTQAHFRKCDDEQWEDQWKVVTTYSIPHFTGSLKPISLNQEKKELLYSSLLLEFEDGLRCPLSDFKVKEEKESIFLVIKNNSACAPFKEGKNIISHLKVVSQLQYPDEYRCGSLTEHFNGVRDYECRLSDGSLKQLSSHVNQDENLLRENKPIGIYASFYPNFEIQLEFKFFNHALESIWGKP